MRSWRVPPARASRGYTCLYVDHVQQADTGADFDFLTGTSGPYVPKRSF